MPSPGRGEGGVCTVLVVPAVCRAPGVRGPLAGTVLHVAEVGEPARAVRGAEAKGRVVRLLLSAGLGA